MEQESTPPAVDLEPAGPSYPETPLVARWWFLLGAAALGIYVYAQIPYYERQRLFR